MLHLDAEAPGKGLADLPQRLLRQGRAVFVVGRAARVVIIIFQRKPKFRVRFLQDGHRRLRDFLANPVAGNHRDFLRHCRCSFTNNSLLLYA